MSTTLSTIVLYVTYWGEKLEQLGQKVSGEYEYKV